MYKLTNGEVITITIEVTTRVEREDARKARREKRVESVVEGCGSGWGGVGGEEEVGGVGRRGVTLFDYTDIRRPSLEFQNWNQKLLNREVSSPRSYTDPHCSRDLT